MPVRHCVFLADLAEMEKAFQLPLSIYVDEFLERPTPGDRLREYAELAFADEQQIQTLRKADRETMVMARRLMVPGQGPRNELPAHMNDVTGDYIKTRTTSQFKWLLHAFAASGRAWMREAICSSGREVLDPTPVTDEAYPWVPKEDGVINFRLVPSLSDPTVARPLATVDFSAQAFQDAGRPPNPRIQELALQNTGKFRGHLQLAFARPAVLAFIGS